MSIINVQVDFDIINRDKRPWEDTCVCEAQVADQTARWRFRNSEDYNCTMHARYKVGGRMYCERHAGRELLRMCRGALDD